MSKTELEEELRATFERAAASVPPAADLAGRAASGAHHAQRRTWLVSGTACTTTVVWYDAGALVLLAFRRRVRGGGRWACGQLTSSRGGEFCWTI